MAEIVKTYRLRHYLSTPRVPPHAITEAQRLLRTSGRGVFEAVIASCEAGDRRAALELLDQLEAGENWETVDEWEPIGDRAELNAKDTIAACRQSQDRDTLYWLIDNDTLYWLIDNDTRKTVVEAAEDSAERAGINYRSLTNDRD